MDVGGVLVSLPVGLLCLFTPAFTMTPPNYDPNPGIGVMALPLIVGWVFTFCCGWDG
jgi:hypothetical protein